MNLTVEYEQETRQFKIAVPGAQQLHAINDWPGWRRHPKGSYYAPAWPSSVIGIGKAVAFQLTWTDHASHVRDSLLHDLGVARGYLSGGELPPISCPTERKPLTHQHQAVAAMRRMDWRVLLGDDMGLGKTSTALWAAYDARTVRLLVVCPVSVKFNWQNEIITTLGDWNTFVIDGTSKQRSGQLVDADQPYPQRAIIINYDLLRHLSDHQVAMLQRYVTSDGAMVLFDEIHYLKNRDSERTKLCAKIAAPCKRVVGMSGTSIRNLADDLYSQVEIVRPGTWTSYRDFAKRHLVIQSVKFGKRDVQKVVGVRNLDALNAVMNTLQIKRRKDEVLGLPPKTYSFPELSLEGDLLKVYKAMKDFAKIELKQLVRDFKCPDCKGAGCSECGGSGELRTKPANQFTIFDPRARSAVEQAMRCEQIAQGFIGGIPQPIMDSLGPDILKLAEKIPGRPNELMFPTAPKVVWMLETIETVLKQGGAPIVGCRFNAPLLWMANYLGKQGVKAWVLHGGLSAAEKHDVVDAFQKGQIDAMLVQVKIAEGWNATRCQDVIHWTRDWSPAINSQFEDRAHRMGQKGTVNVQVPIVRNSIEMMIHRRLTVKGADAEQALRTVTIEELMEAL